MPDTRRPPIDMKALIAAARAAGEAILQVYAGDFAVETKGDDSPLTEADRRSNAVLLTALRSQYPDIPVISEETKVRGYDERRAWSACWLIDPLDGTKEFIKRNGEFTVNIALIVDGEPAAGVVHQPTTETTYFARRGHGAFRQQGVQPPVPIEGGTHYSKASDVTVVASRSHLTPEVEAFVSDLRNQGKTVSFRSAGSSLKICLVADGQASVYPRFGPTMEWDTAAAHAIAAEAGKQLLDCHTRQPLVYNKENLLNPWFIVE